MSVRWRESPAHQPCSKAGKIQAIAVATAQFTRPDKPRTSPIFICALGSCTSWFAWAGILPALAAHYAQRVMRVLNARFKPGARPRKLVVFRKGFGLVLVNYRTLSNAIKDHPDQVLLLANHNVTGPCLRRSAFERVAVQVTFLGPKDPLQASTSQSTSIKQLVSHSANMRLKAVIRSNVIAPLKGGKT